jgi:tetratricopeptide (TPR) repeat protein
MTLFQLILLIATGTVFYLFFKQLFGGSYPKRGVDFEANIPNDRIGGLMQPDKTFAHAPKPQSRIDELLEIADTSAEKNDWLEVKKAMQSARILDENNIDVLRRLGVAQLQMHDYVEAKKSFESILAMDEQDDLAEASLANALHKLGENDVAIVHHERATVLDGTYAPHYYNYANTLYDLERRDEALVLYEKAYTLDPEFKQAKKMIEELRQ